jgi:hypothetical protein
MSALILSLVTGIVSWALHQDDYLRASEIAMVSLVGWLAIFAFGHLIRTPWLVHRSIGVEMETHWGFGIMGIAIAMLMVAGFLAVGLWFYQEREPRLFLASADFGAKDAQIKELQRKLVEPKPTKSFADVYLLLYYGNSKLNGQTIRVAANGLTSNGQPVPNGQLTFQLSEFHFKNDSSQISGAVSTRLYLSRKVSSTLAPWENTPSDERGFPSAFYAGGGIPIYINAHETWNWVPFAGAIGKLGPDDVVSAKLKVFYGAENPVVANFLIRRDK